MQPSEVTASSATLRFTSTIEVACVVVFGLDDGFGQLALDQDMGGSAHSDHRVVLRGLEPDTEYHYRLQGSDPQGNFYASRVMRFRTPAATAKVDLGTDVARLELGARVVEVSSNFGGGDNQSRWGADNVLDGDPGSEWSSDGDGDAAFITVELAEETEVSGFGLWTRTMGTSAQISSFEVIAEDGSSYGPYALDNADGMHVFPAEARGTRFTFRVVASSGGNTGAVELAIFTRSR